MSQVQLLYGFLSEKAKSIPSLFNIILLKSFLKNSFKDFLF